MYVKQTGLSGVTQVNPLAYDEYGDYVPNPVAVPAVRAPMAPFTLDAKTIAIGAAILIALYLFMKKKG